MIDGLGDPEPFFGYGEPLRERTAFGVAVAQPGPRHCCDAAIDAKAFIEQIPLEECHILPITLDGLWIISRIGIGHTQDVTRPSLQADMPERYSHSQGTLAGGDGAVHLARLPEIGAHGGVDLPEPQLVVQRLDEGLGAAQVVE